MAMLLAVPTTLNAANAPLPSWPNNSSMFCAVFDGLYSSSLSTNSNVNVRSPMSTPPSALTFSKYDSQPRAISENAAVRPDCG
jgi:hypothetical protein